MANIPRVRILFSYLLYYGESQTLAKAHNQKIQISEQECINKTKVYRTAWELKEKQILTAMQDLFGLNHHKSTIDVYLAPFFIPKSAPLIINFRHDPDQFVDVLTHELLHNLFTDNQYIKHDDDKYLIPVWQKLFGKKDIIELVHIPIHAGLKAIYLDVLKEPYRLKRDILECQKWPEYKAAWNYVEENDYKEIINKFKLSYQSIK